MSLELKWEINSSINKPEHHIDVLILWKDIGSVAIKDRDIVLFDIASWNSYISEWELNSYRARINNPTRSVVTISNQSVFAWAYQIDWTEFYKGII